MLCLFYAERASSTHLIKTSLVTLMFNCWLWTIFILFFLPYSSVCHDAKELFEGEVLGYSEAFGFNGEGLGSALGQCESWQEQKYTPDSIQHKTNEWMIKKKSAKGWLMHDLPLGCPQQGQRLHLLGWWWPFPTNRTGNCHPCHDEDWLGSPWCHGNQLNTQLHLLIQI